MHIIVYVQLQTNRFETTLYKVVASLIFFFSDYSGVLLAVVWLGVRMGDQSDLGGQARLGRSSFKLSIVFSSINDNPNEFHVSVLHRVYPVPLHVPAK